MSCGTISIPETEWEFFSSGFATITTDLEDGFSMSDVMRVDIYNEEEFFSDNIQETPHFRHFIPKYIRITQIKNLTKKEIQKLGGMEDLLLYIALNKIPRYEVVKIVVFDPLDFNLSDLKSMMSQ